jgi:hypothetical protein
MRYVTIPRDAVLRARAKPGEEPPKYTFKDFLTMDLLRDSRWNSDTTWEAALDDVCAAFGLDGADPLAVGTVVELCDAAHEKLEASVRAFQPASDLRPALRFYVRAITQPDKIDPRPPKPAAPAEGVPT